MATLSKVTQTAAVVGLAMAAACYVPQATAQAALNRYPLTSDGVLAAMTKKGLPTQGVQLRFAAPVTSTVHEAELAIQSASIGDRSSARLLVACRNSSECLPFYVVATWASNADLSALHPFSVDRQSSAASSSEPSPGNLHAGSQAVLLLDSERVHVRLNVICLDGGEPGAHVRASTPDRRRAYQAEVVAPGVLKGSF